LQFLKIRVTLFGTAHPPGESYFLGNLCALGGLCGFKIVLQSNLSRWKSLQFLFNPFDHGPDCFYASPPLAIAFDDGPGRIGGAGTVLHFHNDIMIVLPFLPVPPVLFRNLVPFVRKFFALLNRRNCSSLLIWSQNFTRTAPCKASWCSNSRIS